MVPALLGPGAQAAVAPLWKVDDVVARDVGTGFYRAVLAGRSPAGYLREQRRAARGREGGADGSRLACLYFGHPRLRVAWRPPDQDVPEEEP